jgi:hypothetical protein
MKEWTAEQRDIINQIDNDEFTESELDFLIFFMRDLILSR